MKYEIFKNVEIVENCRYFVDIQLNLIKKINILLFLDCQGMIDVCSLVLVIVFDINDLQFLYLSCDRCYLKLIEDIELR